MSIQKKEYELSVWYETLGENGQKIEKKENIIGAHDMTYLGRATDIKFDTKLNGTHTLTFQMPDKYFDSEKGDYVHNEFVDNLFNERKLKLKFMGEWYEFYIKSVSDTKQFKSYMKKYTCTDAFIDELSRNGYGITFDTELYNNVEEIGTFSRIILEDSIWNYAPEHNWGDFTEYLEEKLFKIPVGGELFPTLIGHKLNYEIDQPRNNEQIINVFNKKKRNLEMGDDLAAAVDGKGGYFWDSYDGSMPLLKETSNVPNDGYIYVPYSQLEFCYATTSNNIDSKKVYTATEEVQYYGDKSYAIAPNTVDPTALIQFIAIPKGAEIEIDEAGLIVNKDYTYVMTVEEWNKNIHSKYYYKFLPKTRDEGKEFYEHSTSDLTFNEAATGNKAAYYEGYLDKIGDLEVIYGKKISISDRTEVNITDEIDQYVTVYNNKYWEYESLYVNPDENWQDTEDEIEYRVCSKMDTRQIVPQLARNLIQNGTIIKTTDGWEPQKIYDRDDSLLYSSLRMNVGSYELPSNQDSEFIVPEETFLEVKPAYSKTESKGPYNPDLDLYDWYNTVLNFGIVGQEIEITCDKIYCLGIKIGLEVVNNTIPDFNKFDIKIGEGKILTEGEYEIECPINPSIPAEKGTCIQLLDVVIPPKSVSEAITIKTKADDGYTDITKRVVIAEGYVYVKFNQNVRNPYIALTQSRDLTDYYLFSWSFFEAYTKGIDQFDSQDLIYRYSGRDLFDTVLDKSQSNINVQLSYPKTQDVIHNEILFEEDVMPGDTYEYQKYFIQQVTAYESSYEDGARIGGRAIADTFAQRELLNNYAEIIPFKNANYSYRDLPYSAAQFTNDDLQIATKYIDLNKCPHYKQSASKDESDCSYNGEQHICLYQKYGYCPYLFQTEKHCRKIRTLKGEKSNRFNLTQELSKVFEIYPIYWTEHYENGKIVTDAIVADEETQSLTGQSTYQKMRKKVFYITEKGTENKLGFRYEKNLSNISRDIKSDAIVTKLYVQDVDSDLSKTGLCSIKTAEDNPSKDSFIINFNYYTTKGILDKNSVDADLYGKDNNDLGYLKQLGYYNTEYDKISNSIINLENASFNELEANVNVNVEGIEAAQKQLFKIKKDLDRYKSQIYNGSEIDEAATEEANAENQTYQNYLTKYEEQLYILNNLIFETFFDAIGDSNYSYYYQNIANEKDLTQIGTNNKEPVSTFFDQRDLQWMKESSWFKQHTYACGMLGQYNREYLQISEWKKQQAAYLKEINKLSLKFFRKYEPYLKEGTWSDSNYISDNAYYFGAVEVAAEGAIPKVSYNISVVDLYSLPEYEDYLFNIADTTYVEDIGMFGINPITGLPNRLKVLISGITYDLDQPTQNSITVQNFTTQFADLFQQVTASVQSLSFNENIYKRASNFTSNQNIEQSSLQGTLDTNQMTLINTDESNIELDKTGQAGSDINNHNNKYKLDGQGMSFSNNGGQSWSVGVGPSGINADFIKVGTLDAGKIRIVDNSYLYFLWDKNGITAFRDPQNTTGSIAFNDYALFNRYGLSLVEEGKIRLRAGYSFNGANASDPQALPQDYGKILTETSQGNNIGFYLYNTDGDPIFKTESATENDAALETARLSLVGEMFVTNSRLTEAESEVSTGLPIYSIESGYNLSQKLVNNYVICTDPSWQTKIQLEIGDTIQVGGETYVLTRREEENIQYCLINDELGVNYLTEIVLFFEPDENSSGNSITEYFYLIEDESECYSKTNSAYTIYVIDNSDITAAALTLDDNMIQESYNVYPQIDGELNQVLTLSLIITSKGYDSTTGRAILLDYSFWCSKVDTGETTPGSQPDNTEVVGLFINNKISLNSTDEEVKRWADYYDDYTNKRIFSCAGINADESNVEIGSKNNIFSILKNGSLYIGGSILKPNGDSTQNMPISELPDVIKIDKPQIVMRNDGKVYMAFDSFYNIDENGNFTTDSLSSTISSVVNSIRLPRHSHAYDLWVELDTLDIIGEEDVNLNAIKWKYVIGPSSEMSLTNEDKAAIKEYLEEHVVYTIQDFLDRIAFDPLLSNLDVNSGNKEIVKSTISGDRIIREVPVQGEIKEAGSGSSYTSEGPYLIDPINEGE